MDKWMDGLVGGDVMSWILKVHLVIIISSFYARKRYIQKKNKKKSKVDFEFSFACCAW